MTYNKKLFTSLFQGGLVAMVAIGFTIMPFAPGFGLVQSAGAADTLAGPDSATVDRAAEYTTTTADASEHENLMLEFDYDAESLSDGDSFTYGWRTGGGDTDLDTINGADEATTTGSVSTSLPAGAQATDLQVYVSVDADTDADEVEISNLTVVGEATSPTAALARGDYYDDPDEEISPILECVVDEGDGDYTAYFGYENDNEQDVEVEVGEDNKVTGGGLSGQDQGQPELFEYPAPNHPDGREGRTGFVDDDGDFAPENAAFSVAFDGSNLVWTLEGPDGETRTATASSGSTPCPEPKDEGEVGGDRPSECSVSGDLYADDVFDYSPGDQRNGNDIASDRDDADEALGEPEDDNTFNFVSLGFGGEITLEFDHQIENNSGDDFRVYETTFDNETADSYPETAEVWVSQDGEDYELVGTATLADDSFNLSDSSFEWVRFIKLVDTSDEDDFDDGDDDGFDLDGIAVINCDSQPEGEETEVTLIAHKIMCENEADLPDWDNQADDIDGDTAQDWVDQSKGSCWFEPDWEFQWTEGYLETSDGDGEIRGEKDGWNTFGPTNADGAASTTFVLDEDEDWFTAREVLQEGYIPFSDAFDDGPEFSAEFYCANDVKKYDNNENVWGDQGDDTHHCVAFNVPEEPQPEPEPEEEVTVVPHKVICEAESDLPNWGSGADVDADTAQDWVEDHPGCSLEPNWEFQWAPGTQVASVGDDSFTGEKGEPWATFSGTTTIDIENIEDLSFREVLQEGYIPFTFLTEGKQNTDDVSAEFYCSGAGINYDNNEWIRGVQDGEMIQCVGFNVLEEPTDPGPGDDNQLNLSGYKFHNENEDRDRDEGEERLADWGFRLYEEVAGDWTQIDSATTTEDGNYSFDTIQEAGTYHICEVAQAGWSQVRQDWSGTPFHVVTDNTSPNADEEGPYCATITYTDEGDRSAKKYFGNKEGQVLGEQQCNADILFLDTANGGALFSVDETDGSTNELQNYDGDFHSVLADDDGVLYSIRENGQLVTLDGNGATTDIGDTDITKPVAMDFGQDGKLYVLDQVGDNLYTVDKTNGDATSLGGQIGEATDSLSVNGGDIISRVNDGEIEIIYVHRDGIIYAIDPSDSPFPSFTELGDIDSPTPAHITSATKLGETYYALDQDNTLYSFEISAGSITNVQDEPDTGPYGFGDATCAVAPVDEIGEPGQCLPEATVTLNQSTDTPGVADVITEFLLNNNTVDTNDSFEMFVSGDSSADGNHTDEVRVERTADGFELYFYGDPERDSGVIEEFSGSFMLDDVDASSATISEGNEPLEMGAQQEYEDEISINTTTGEVSFTLYVSTGHDSFVVDGFVDQCEEPGEPTTTGTISGDKFHDDDRDGDRDEGENGLEGWRIAAYNDDLLHQSLTLDASDEDGIDTSTLDSDNFYVVEVVGTWTNKAGNGNPDDDQEVDAEYYDEDGFDGNEEDFGNDGDPSTDDRLIDVVIDDQQINWGSFDSGSHKYAILQSGGDDSVNLRVWDTAGNYDDNAGSLTVNIYEIPAQYVAVTDSDGSYSFTVPAGDYTVLEQAQEDWVQTTPTNPSYHEVTIEEDDEVVRDFGNDDPDEGAGGGDNGGDGGDGGDETTGQGGGGGILNPSGGNPQVLGDQDDDDDNGGQVAGDSDVNMSELLEQLRQGLQGLLFGVGGANVGFPLTGDGSLSGDRYPYGIGK